MKINPHTLDAYKLMHEGTLAFARAEQAGLRIDTEYVEKQRKKLTKLIGVLEEEFKETNFYRHWQHSMKGKVNIYSPTQLGTFLYKIKKIEVEKETVSGKGAVDDEALQQMGIPELETLLQIRKYKKVRDTYLEAFAREQVDGVLHPFFNLHLVQTFRSSSDSPNFQNIPKKDEESMQLCRRAILPRKGHQLIEIDFSGIEVRVGACYHKDPQMIKYIKDPTTDMHGDMARQIFKVKDFNKKIPEHYVLRQAAKNGFVFPQFYGASYKSCTKNLLITWGKLTAGKWKPGQGIAMPEGTLSDHLIAQGLTSYDKFMEHLKKIDEHFWHERFSVYTEWKDRWYEAYKKNGYFDLKTGFRCTGLMDKRQTGNWPIQGTAFHCNLWSFIQADKSMVKEKWDTKLVGQIHDSIILDVNKDELKYIAEKMHKITSIDLPKTWTWIIVPLEVEMDLCEIDAPWADKKEFKF
jgi:DNA polymerase I-like protein with 3'-5' exonuclease and polymerase domains